MAAGVPFVPLAAVQLVSVAADLGLGVASLAPRWRARGSALAVGGGVLLAAVDIATAVRLGTASSDALLVLRAIALLLLAGALAQGALGCARGGGRPRTGAAAAVLVPLGGGSLPALATAAAGLLAAVMARRARAADRWWAGALVGGLACWAAAGALAATAGEGTGGASAVLAARGVGAVLLLAGLARIAGRSLLAQVVGAALVGVLLMAIGAVAVGGYVASGVQQQQERQLAELARSEAGQLQNQRFQLAGLSQLLAACPDVATCSRLFSAFGSVPDAAAARVYADGRVQPLSGTLSASEVLGLRTDPLVLRTLAADPTTRDGGGELARLGAGVAVLGVSPAPGSAAPVCRRAGGSRRCGPPYVAVYAGRLGNGYAEAVHERTGDDATVLAVGGAARDAVLGSDLGATDAARVATVALSARTPSGLGPAVRVSGAVGARPTVAVAAVLPPDDISPLGLLALSRPAAVALQAERRALVEVFLTSVVVLLLVALVAYALGRRVVRPVRRLTSVATQVRRGDLDARADLQGADEVGVLGRAVDAMTASLQRSTGELRDAAARQEALARELEAVLDAVTEALVVLRPDGTLGRVNPAAERLTASLADGLLGQPARSALTVTGPDGEVDLRREGAGEGLLHRSDGGLVPVSYASAPLDVPGAAAVVVLRDLTREREVERMKTEFLSNVSHELRTPLTPIRGYAELLRRRDRALPEPRRAAALDQIAAGSLQLTRLVDLIVDVAAIDAGRVSPEPVEVVLGRWLDERLAHWRTQVPERAADLRRRVAADVPVALVDPRWLAKAYDELVGNALKHTAPGTTVTLVAAAGGRDRVVVGVRDAGPGIEPQVLPALLDDFRQSDGSATRATGGLGLGLAFVRRVADAQGMRVVVRSTPGKGSEFGLELTVAPSRATVPVRRRAVRAR